VNTNGPPENGVRFELVLRSLEAGIAHYEGHAFLPTTSVPISIRTSVAEAKTELGEPSAPIAPERLAAIEKLGTALVRAATRVELQKGEAIPQKLVRWRAFDS
jgi:hypothetical protein